MPSLHLRLLGHPTIEISGHEVEGFHSNKGRALLFYLAMEGTPQARHHLAGLFWTDFPEQRAMGNLRRELSNLGGLVGDHLKIERSHVELIRSDSVRLDAAEFEAALTQAAQQEADDRLEYALSLYAGDLLDGFELRGAPGWESWLRAERSRLRTRYHQGLLTLGQRRLQSNDAPATIELAQRLVQDDPLSEVGHRLLMGAFARNGQRTLALRQFDRCSRILADELGVEPSGQTVALAGAIQSGELSTAGRQPEATEPPERMTRGRDEPEFLKPSASPDQGEAIPFFGRQEQLEQLHQLLDSAIQGKGTIGFIAGEAGRGKSALLHEFGRQAQERHPSLIVALGTCDSFAGEGDPYHPFRQVLRMLCGDVEDLWHAGLISADQASRLWRLSPLSAEVLATHGPGLLARYELGVGLYERASQVVPPGSASLRPLKGWLDQASGDLAPAPSLQSEFSDTLLGLAQHEPLLLMLDDLQWIDSASLQLLFHLSQELSTGPILMLGAYRPSDLAIAQSEARTAKSATNLPSAIAELRRRFGGSIVDLDQIPAGAERRFIDDLISSQAQGLDPSFRTAFHERTSGYPLFAIELLRELKARGDLTQQSDGTWIAEAKLEWDQLPSRVESVISMRMERLPDDMRQIVSVASVAGEVFSAQVVANALDKNERQVLRKLRQLDQQHALVQELAEFQVGRRVLSRHRFRHALFCEYAYRHLSEGERRLLHAAIGRITEDIYAGQLDAVSLTLAQHFIRGSEPKRAIPYLLTAGDQARLQNASSEALEHYRQALTILKRFGRFDEAAHTLMKIALTHHNASEFEEARQANAEALELWKHRRPQGDMGIGQPPHPLRIAGESYSGDLDPAMAKEAPRGLLLQQLFSGLMRLGPDMEILPDLVERWEVLDQGNRYIFYLNPDARWSDGEPISAEDVSFSWKRVLDPATGSPNARDLFDLRGALAFHSGTAGPDQVGVRPLDASTLQVELERASPYFPNLLYYDSTKPVPKHAIAKYGADWLRPENIVTSGPFRLVTLDPDELIVMERNGDYSGEFHGNVQRVEVHLGLGEDRLEHLSMYRSGDLDVLYTFPHLPPKTQRVIYERLVGEVHSGPSLALWMIGFVLDRPPFDDPRVRRAVCMATDRDALANMLHHGLLAPASGGFLTPVHAAHSEGIALPYDPDRARRELAEAGYPNGGGIPVIRLVSGHASMSVEADLAYLQDQWRQNLGLQLEWETVWDMGDFLRRMRDRPPHMFFIRWSGRHSDPDDFLNLESSLIWDIARWQDPTYFEMLEQARRRTKWSERMILYREADKRLIEQAVLLPLVYDRTHFLVKPWVEGFAPSAIPRWPLTQVILRDH